jgi:hypothetical protein
MGFKLRDAVLPLCVVALCLLALDVSQLNVETAGRKFQDIGGILVPLECNAGNHLYPYLATALTCGCIILSIIVIIVFGSAL